MSDSKTVDDGGPAFPVPNDANTNGQEGMSLRDWFAGHALEGYMSILDSRNNPDYQEDATFMYQLADAMLIARKELPRGEATKTN